MFDFCSTSEQHWNAQSHFKSGTCRFGFHEVPLKSRTTLDKWGCFGFHFSDVSIQWCSRCVLVNSESVSKCIFVGYWTLCLNLFSIHLKRAWLSFSPFLAVGFSTESTWNFQPSLTATFFLSACLRPFHFYYWLVDNSEIPVILLIV